MAQTESNFLAGVDAGGTTFKCGLATSGGRLVAETRVATGAAEDTIAACAEFLNAEATTRNGAILALGVASFGPLNVDPASEGYGKILNTPKPGWAGADLLAGFRTRLNVPVCVDTDVNGALLAELKNGAAAGCGSAAYVTVGTGIGAGVFQAGLLVGKPLHPEFGHIRVQRHPDDAAYPGRCPFHGDCLEGLASAPAFTDRYGDPTSLDADHPGWRVLAHYLAQACWSLSLSFRVERIILGGGLMLAPHLIMLVRENYVDLSGGYLGETPERAERMIVRPGHGDNAGLLGGVELAARLIGKSPR